VYLLLDKIEKKNRSSVQFYRVHPLGRRRILGSPFREEKKRVSLPFVQLFLLLQFSKAGCSSFGEWWQL
jgi:hypothetical protein